MKINADGSLFMTRAEHDALQGHPAMQTARAMGPIVKFSKAGITLSGLPYDVRDELAKAKAG